MTTKARNTIRNTIGNFTASVLLCAAFGALLYYALYQLALLVLQIVQQFPA